MTWLLTAVIAPLDPAATEFALTCRVCYCAPAYYPTHGSACAARDAIHRSGAFIPGCRCAATPGTPRPGTVTPHPQTRTISTQFTDESARLILGALGITTHNGVTPAADFLGRVLLAQALIPDDPVTRSLIVASGAGIDAHRTLASLRDTATWAMGKGQLMSWDAPGLADD